MGNTVSAAEIAASQIVNPNAPPSYHYAHHHHQSFQHFQGDIPPECPMHTKTKPKSYSLGSECPVGEGNGNINPLNMVSGAFKCVQSMINSFVK
ncbi:unnamed protein product [Callosobruchus maculatus]|uniref:Uncharacterized protein n=1 Tax=Callosobruchus maculatus TaxID=64391 RepID=A0A653BJN8_CALMS|nr:unnamed protein product [Callosobruchus maculatus]